MTRKIFIIISIVILVSGSLAIYLYRPNISNPSTDEKGVISLATNNLPNLRSFLENSSANQTIKKLITNSTSTFYQVSDLDVIPRVATIDIASTTAIFFIDAKTGQVYRKLKYGDPERLSVDIVKNPIDLEAVILPGNKILLFLETVNENGISLLTGLTSLTSTTSINWQPLSSAINQLIVSPNNDQLAYTKIVGERLFLYTSLPDFTNEQAIWSSPYTSWNVSYYNRQGFLAQSKSDSNNQSLTTLINPSTRSAQNLTTATGLTIFSGQNQPYYIETFVQNNQLQSHFILPNNPALSQKLEIPIFTDLCSESRDPVFLYCAIPDSSVSNYPTAWYQGRENYRFKIVAINPLNGQVGNLYLPNSNISFNQLSSLKVNSRNTTLYFVKNNKLWQYDLLP